MKRNKKALVLIVISFIAAALYAKSNKSVEKYVHPRSYTIDLADSETKAVFSYDGEKLTADLVFSEMLKDDMPRAGDRIKFVFSGYSTKQMGEFAGLLYDRIPGSGKKGDFAYKAVYDGEPEILCDNVMRSVSFRGINYFILTDDVDNALCLRITVNYADNPKKLNKTGVRFFKVTKSTNTTREQEILRDAEKKGYEIINVTSDFSTEDDEDEDEDEEFDFDHDSESDEIEAVDEVEDITEDF